ncbi:hypothetical protein [Dokdonia sp. Asnod2-E02]|uniref:hypothetical protein n=1 Tax=Dokdonia sp. Asnod2-E02 TaxID=3160574 RepID=UPI0038691DFF
MKKLLVLIILSLSLVTCESDDLDCANVLCAPGPAMVITFFDAETGEQLYTDTDGEAPEEFTVTVQNDLELLYNQGYVFQDGELVIYVFPEMATIVQESFFDVTINATVQTQESSGCCPDYSISNINATGGDLTVTQSPELRLRIDF